MGRQRKWTDEELVSAVASSFAIRTVLQKLNLIPAGGNYASVQSRIVELQLDVSHFTGKGHLKGKTHDWGVSESLEVTTAKLNPNRSKLKAKLIKNGLLVEQCATCSIDSWLGMPLVLHLDHVDGDNTNNHVENLRLLCPNCHSQTSTYCGRNKGAFLRRMNAAT